MLQINTSTRGTFAKDPLFVATTISSPYTPYIARFICETVHTNDDYFMMYHKPVIMNSSIMSFRINTLIDYLNDYVQSRYVWIDAAKSTRITIGKGYIADKDDKLLLMLSYKAKSHVNTHGSYDMPTKENGKNMTLFISTELLMNPVYALFYKKLDKAYIQDAFKLDLPVIFTTSDKIEELHYSNEFKVEFNSVNEFQNHLQNQVGQLINMSDETFKQFNPGIGKRERIMVEPIVDMEEMSQDEIAEIDEFLGQPTLPVQALRRRVTELRNTISTDVSIATSYIAGIDPITNATISSYGQLNTDMTHNLWNATAITEEGGIQLVDDREGEPSPF